MQFHFVLRLVLTRFYSESLLQVTQMPLLIIGGKLGCPEAALTVTGSYSVTDTQVLSAL